jgi:hypothetical protein
MKLKTIFVFATILFCANLNAQVNQIKCEVSVSDYGRTITFGYLIAYYVEFKNDSKKTVDGIYFTTNFYNNAGDVLSTKAESFNSTNLVGPIKPGNTKKIFRSPRLEGVSKVGFTIEKVHFTDGTSCQ